MRLFADQRKCSGCRACLVACTLNLFQENTTKNAALLFIPHFPEPGNFELKVCTQCGKCAAVCPTNAIIQNEKGAYYVQADLCDLCNACVAACPESVMFSRPPEVAHSWKCDLCGDCVLVCGMDALWIAETESIQREDHQ